METPKMPEPTGEMANVPSGWPPQTWGAHLANINWMKEVGQGHYSRTDPKWHIRKFKERLLEDDRRRVIQILRDAGIGNADIERKILDSSETEVPDA